MGKRFKVKRHKPRGETGQAMVAAVLVLAMLLAIGTGLLASSFTERRISANQVDASKAFYLAEAGAQKAIAELRADPSWRVSNNQFSLGDGTVQLTAANGGGPDLVNVTSKGTVRNVTRTIVLSVQARRIKSAFDYALLSYGASGTNTISKDAILVGDVFSNQSLTIEKGVEIKGNVTSNANISLDPSASVQGAVQQNAGAEVPETPVLPQGWYLKGDLGTPVVINGNVTKSSQLSTGAKYYIVHGNVSLGRDTSLSGITVEADGNVTIDSSSHLDGVTLAAGGNLYLGKSGSAVDSTLVASGTLTLREKGQWEKAVAVAGGTFSLEKDSRFSGVVFAGGGMNIGRSVEATASFVAKSFFLDRDSELTFEENLVSEVLPPALGSVGGSQVDLLDWQEQ